MVIVQDFLELGLNISWRLLNICFSEHQMQAQEIIAFAYDLLEKGEDSALVCDLAGAYPNEEDRILALLEQLVEEENTQNDFEKKKLRVVLVKKVLNVKNHDCIQGLMDLSDLWGSLGYPNDSPHIIQGRDNNIEPVQYYTKENYDDLFAKNLSWVEKELLYLTENQ